jgi:small subunit ribosomal protein S20
MANNKSAEKRAKQADRRRLANRAVATQIASERRKFFEAVASGDRAKSEELRRAYVSLLDNAARHGVIKKNAASRRKSRAALKLAALAR